jgi:LPS-assembly protein
MVVGQDPAAAPSLQKAVEITAQKTEYRNNNLLWVLTGDVLAKHGETQLRADYMTYDTTTHDIYGRGNVQILHEGREYTGEEFNYNLETGAGDWLDLEILQGAFSVTSDSMQRVGKDNFVMQNATITTCQGDPPEVYLRAKEASVSDDKRLEAKHVVLYVRGVPVFYLPYLKKNLNASESNLDVVPGYSSRWGAFLLTSYRYRLNTWLEGKTHVDYRSERGRGIGQDFQWRDQKEERYHGEFRVYYADDQMPFEDELDKEQPSPLVDSDRYRFKLRHRHSLTEKDTLRVTSDYLSDPDVLEDFYDKEFRQSTVPENFATLTHRDDKYTAALDFNFRVNDFYRNTDRLPAASLDVPRMQLGDSQFYYESGNSAAYLQNSFADQLKLQDVESGRVDTRHVFTYYTKQLGWLNLSPHVGYQGTYYSETPEKRTVISTSVTTNEAGEVAGGTTESVETIAGGSDLRNVFEIVLDASFKAFKELSNQDRGRDVGYRHVIEPFASYAYVPKPNVTPDELYQFDSLDRLNEKNDLGIGLRNKLQTKRNGRLHDLAYLELFTVANVDKAPTETETVEDLFFDAEFKIFERSALDIRGNYDFVRNDLEQIDVDFGIESRGRSSLGMQYLFRDKSRESFATELNLFPRRRWSYTGYARYDIKGSDLQEHSHFIRHKTNCLGIGLGVRETGSDITVWAQLWLLAFPGSSVELGR